MNRPTVSIIVNCLNGEKDLPEALESIKMQLFQDFEIIFWDNDSTDHSAAIALSFGPKLRYFKSDKTIPLGEARNKAIAQANGEYIAFLDCDDIWRPEKLTKQVELFRANPKLGLVCTDTEVYNDKKKLYRLFEQSKPERGRAFAALMTGQWISMSSAMLRRTALDMLLTDYVQKEDQNNITPMWFDNRLNVCEEADLFYRIAHDWEIDYVDMPLTVWRIHGSNTTFRKFEQFADETLLILEKHRMLYPNYDVEYKDIVEILVRRASFQKAVAMWRNNKGNLARQLLHPYINSSTKYKLFWLVSFLPSSFFDLASRLYFRLPSSLRKH